jgi:hypothetical protein
LDLIPVLAPGKATRKSLNSLRRFRYLEVMACVSLAGIAVAAASGIDSPPLMGR